MSNGRGYKTKWITGDWDVICDSCGFKKKRSECELSYDSGNLAVFVTCSDTCSDKRHPLNDPPPIFADGLPVPDGRPDYIASNPSLGYTISINNQGQSTTSGDLNRPSIYRLGKSWPSHNLSQTNDNSGFSFNPKQLLGNFN